MMSGYDENEIGALDCDDIEGTLAVDSAIVMKCADEFAQQKAALELEKAASKNVAMMQDSDNDDMIDLKVDARARDKWDCESILSTYSNIYNHPKLIPREQSKNMVIILIWNLRKVKLESFCRKLKFLVKLDCPLASWDEV
jgi:protein LTV1